VGRLMRILRATHQVTSTFETIRWYRTILCLPHSKHSILGFGVPQTIRYYALPANGLRVWEEKDIANGQNRWPSPRWPNPKRPAPSTVSFHEVLYNPSCYLPQNGVGENGQEDLQFKPTRRHRMNASCQMLVDLTEGRLHPLADDLT
jgi:hypothetical protein